MDNQPFEIKNRKYPHPLSSRPCVMVLAVLLLATAGCGCPSDSQGEAPGESPAAIKGHGGKSTSAPEKPPSEATKKVELNGHTFTLPVDFDIELAVEPSLLKFPISADFDEQGNLYVTESTESMVKEDVPRKKNFRVLKLTDTRGDGKFDKATVFTDKMPFLEGAMWHRGSLYVAAPPSIWKLTDTKGTGQADQRTEWFQGKTRQGCANDLHGPYLGLDGWIYWCKGGFEKQIYERPGKAPFVTSAAHIFRSRLDGSGLEPVMTGGMDNPVSVAFTPGGERIFCTTFLQGSRGGKRDGLIHAIYGGIYGKESGVIHDRNHKWTGPAIMPPLTHLGPAAPAAVICYEGDAFGPEYKDNLFVALFNLHKVTRHILEPDGASFKTRDHDLLVSSNRDFHPTDVVEDADGSLLIVDTGGWYKICCPTSQLVKPDVLGAIYRVRRVGRKGKAPATVHDDPRGLKIEWDKLSSADLVQLLADPRRAVQRRAIDLLGVKGAEAVPALTQRSIKGKELPATSRNFIWAATRIDDPDARAFVRLMLTDPDETVRQAALHSVSIWRDREAVPELLKLLRNKSLHNRRAAAEALGRIGDRAAVPALLEALVTPSDRALEHSLTFALIEIADRDGTLAGLKNKNPRVKRAALIALDQMDSGDLDPKMVTAELDNPNPLLRETAWWITGRHPEWGDVLTQVFRDRLNVRGLAADRQEQLASRLARFARTQAIQQFIAERLRDPKDSLESRRIVLRAMALARLPKVPESWLIALTDVLEGNNLLLINEAVTTAQALRFVDKGPVNHRFVAALLKLGNDPAKEKALRLKALAAVPGGLTHVEPGLFAFVRSMLSAEPVIEKSLAAKVIAKARLDNKQLIELADALKTVGPMEIRAVVMAYAQSGDEKVGLVFAEALAQAPHRANLLVETLVKSTEKYPASVQEKIKQICIDIEPKGPEQIARLDELMPLMKKGNKERGQALFNGLKKDVPACISCHIVGAVGGTVGPDLTKIGQIRNERDLLESIVYPSASFAPGYDSFLVFTKDGVQHEGMLRKDSGDEVGLVKGPNKEDEVTIAKSDIEIILPSKKSIMPDGFDGLFTPQELADLVAFLKACR